MHNKSHQHGASGHQVAREEHVCRPPACFENSIKMMSIVTKQKKTDLVKKNSSGNTCAEKVSWKGHYERVFTGVGDESTESYCLPTPHSIGNPPSASHAFCCCCQTN